MLLSAVKIGITRLMAQSYALPDDTKLAEFINSALIYVASQCEPQVLLGSHDDGEDADVLRELSENMYVRFPEYPDFSVEGRHLNIDEGPLCQAVMQATCFMLSGDAKFDTVCERWMFIHKKNTIFAYAHEEVE